MQGRSAVLVLMLGVCACGGDKDKIGDPQVDAAVNPDMGGGGVAGHARIVVATSNSMAFWRSANGGGSANVADGRWLLSPNAAKITFTSLTLLGEGTNIQNVPLTSCQVTYTRGATSGTELLDCPFEAPAGMYLGVAIAVGRVSQILIDDSTTGLYTDPASSTRLATSPPGGGAAYVEFRPPGPGGTTGDFSLGGYFAAPFMYGTEQGASTDVYIATDMFHTVYANVSGSVATLDETLPIPPVLVVPSIGAAGREEFYTSTGTALNTPGGGPTDNDGFSLRVSYPPTSSQPYGAFSPYAGQSSPRDPATSDVYPDGCKRGGYLGLDGSGVLCWAQPVDCTYASYVRVCRITPKTTVGDTTSLECESRTTAPAPTSGETYASGCPTITPDVTQTLTLVAR